jgi:hypothetical protein
VEPPEAQDIMQRKILVNLSRLLKFLWATLFVAAGAIIIFRPVKSVNFTGTHLK